MKYPMRFSKEQWDALGSSVKKAKLITFDAYNTLYSTTLPVMVQYAKVGRKYGIKTSAEELTSRFPKVFKTLRDTHPNYGKHTGLTALQWWEMLISNVYAPVDIPKQMISEILHIFEGFGAYTVYPDLLELLKLIRQRSPGTILAVVSNTDPIMYKLIKNIGLEPYFDSYVYLSYDLEVAKPDNRFFDAVLEDIVNRTPNFSAGLDMQELKSACWHIGDEEGNDLRGAYSAGWNGVLLDRTDKYQHFSVTRNNQERQLHQLFADKIDNDASKSWESSMQQTDILQLSDREYVVANFGTLGKLLFK
ncbi:LAME_0F17810g1_1 [Lachancea meyersii CBS 8951]|uniref:LAME_0F17810g1_1 n=1 Tax=Lachancea meyersii CBS 8951 TaxID=1266667 RepID=A0A1G4K063_9SACH|nr:LAME_0F17810g1_1 [Lachancea meyersii CBS 8951]